LTTKTRIVRIGNSRGIRVPKVLLDEAGLPEELNHHLRTVIVAPMTTAGRAYPWRIRCRFQQRSGYVVLDQLRTVDRERLVKRLGSLSSATLVQVLGGLQEMFAD
jgi:mRNA interferase MazF